MSSPSRLLAAGTARAETTAATLLSTPTRHLDDDMRALLAEEHARGVREGHRAGAAETQQAVRDTAEQLRAALETHLAALTEQVQQQHHELAAALETRVLAAVRAVLGGEPADPSRLVARLVEAVSGVEAPSLTVRVPDGAVELTRAAFAHTAGVEVVADARLGPDEALVDGRDVAVDLRQQRLLDELAEVLASADPLGPVGAPDADEPGSDEPGSDEPGSDEPGSDQVGSDDA